MNQTKLEQKLRHENDTLVKKNESLHELVAAAILKLVEARFERDEAQARFEHERFIRRVYMYGFYAVAILNIISSLCYFL